MSFKVGDKAIYIGPKIPFHGLEVTVISVDHDVLGQDSVYVVYNGHGWATRPSRLEPIIISSNDFEDVVTKIV